jgi:hypothetical protein
LIAIDNVLLSDEVIEAQFVCDLDRCLGGCCVDGDCGAPLTEAEAQVMPEVFADIQSMLPETHLQAIAEQGVVVWDAEHGQVTPTVHGGICVYALTDEKGIVKCAIERAYVAGQTAHQKPISCHLFPIRITQSEGFEAVNYEPRKKLCRPACKLGKKLKIPVYKFLKDALVRKYGLEFYETLDAVANRTVEG